MKNFLMTILITVNAMAITSSYAGVIGNSSGGGALKFPTILQGEKFSFSCEIGVRTANLVHIQKVQLNNELNEFMPKLQAEGIYVRYGTNEDLSSNEVKEELSGMEGGAMREFEEPGIFVLEGASPSEFNLYINGKMKGYTPQPFLNSSSIFSTSSEKIKAELTGSHGHATEEYGITVNCVNNNSSKHP